MFYFLNVVPNTMHQNHKWVLT